MHPESWSGHVLRIEQFMLYGVVVLPAAMQTLIAAVLTNLGDFEYVCYNKPFFIELAEICGGEARTSRLAARRTRTHRPNFDMVLGVGLTGPSNQQRVCGTSAL